MRRKFLFGLLAAALLFPVAAVPVAQANIGECINPTADNHFNGNYQYQTGSQHVNEVRGTINVGGHFWPCSDSPPTIYKHDMANMHASIEPAAGNNYSGIIQVGIVSCTDAWKVYCTGQGSRRIVGEVSGCGYHNEYDFGPGPSDAFVVRVVVWSTSVTLHYYTDTNGWVLAKTAPKTDPALACWINGYTKGVWTGETWDSGDSLGDSDNPTTMTFAEFKTTENSTLRPANWPTGTCLKNESGASIHHTCINDGTNKFYVYSS